MSEDRAIIPLFSSPVVKVSIEERTDQLNPHDFKFRSGAITGKEQSNLTLDLRVLDKYPRIKRILLKAFNEIIHKQLGYGNEFRISTSWFTRTAPGSSSQIHCHKNSFWSGVYYFNECKKGTGKIQFFSPIVSDPDFFLVPHTSTVFNAQSFAIDPQKKMLLLFPSYLRHRIVDHEEDEERFSLAFNIVPVGEYGEYDSTYNSAWF